ncbi:glutaredoxin 2 [Sphingobium sp. YR657]|uniref:glutaredoxin 2 n=1 Tax=Sphingobium sp. YR657 TaxID=1884366 RepID=UPI0009102C62|nr:glutaredoxin 2 [Sphingobium sp. YR657]SHM44075.1 glutaredoxin 2 [Sphingobium sp. YR657]
MKLYVYDHCPFCVKARSIFGLKRIPFELVIMLNDDEATPSRMIGKKMAPILEHDGRFIPESMDIVAHIDAMTNDAVLVGPRNPRIAQWIDDATSALYPLAMPRWAASGMTEFATPQARATFTRNKEAIIGSFADNLAKSGDYIAYLDKHLQSLDKLIQSPDAVNGVLSEDDIHLFACLRALSIVRGITYPTAVSAYRMRMAARTGVDLHDESAA